MPNHTHTSATAGHHPGLLVRSIAELPGATFDREFVGENNGEVGVSMIMLNARPGAGPALHHHEYAEIIVILEGQADLTDGHTTITVTAGHIAVIQPGHPHAFHNSGNGQMHSIDIHLNERFATHWLANG